MAASRRAERRRLFLKASQQASKGKEALVGEQRTFSSPPTPTTVTARARWESVLRGIIKTWFVPVWGAGYVGSARETRILLVQAGKGKFYRGERAE